MRPFVLGAFPPRQLQAVFKMGLPPDQGPSAAEPRLGKVPRPESPGQGARRPGLLTDGAPAPCAGGFGVRVPRCQP